MTWELRVIGEEILATDPEQQMSEPLSSVSQAGRSAVHRYWSEALVFTAPESVMAARLQATTDGRA